MPLYQPPASGSNDLLQTLNIKVAVDTTTNSTSDVTLISTSVITSGGKLVLLFDASCSNTTTNAQVFFDLAVDGTVVKNCAVRFTGAPAVSCGLNDIVTNLATGTHTVAVQWHVSAGTGQIRPVVAPTTESASLIIMEVLV